MNLFSGSQARILVIAAHADDEVLGAGATLFEALRADASVHVAILSTNSFSRDVDDAARVRLQQRRIEAARENSRMLGWSLSLYDHPDNAFDTIPLLTITKIIEREIAEFRPSVLITHFPGDVNNDHRIVCAASMAASRPLGRYSPAAVLFSEVVSSTHWSFGSPQDAFVPSLWVPVSAAALDAKVQAVEMYVDEIREWPHRRSREGVQLQAKYRGSEVGLDFAEAFVIARLIDGARR